MFTSEETVEVQGRRNDAVEIAEDLVRGEIVSFQKSNFAEEKDRLLTNELIKRTVCGKKQECVIRERLSNEAITKLMNAYPSIDFDFKAEVNNPHGLAAASRHAEELILYNKAGLTKNEENNIYRDIFDSEYDSLVCDVGGNYPNMLNNNFDVHCCSPIVDLKDSMRDVNRRERFEGIITRRSSKRRLTVREEAILRDYRTLNANPTAITKTLCRQKVQDCTKTARTLLLCHSCYDISLSDLGKAMVNKKSEVAYGTFIYSSEIFLGDEGIFKDLNVHFKKDIKKKTITFSFVEDDGTYYTHDLYTYLQYILMPAFTLRHNKKDYFFTIELLENIMGIQYFKITKLKTVPKNNSVIKHRVWIKGNKDLKKISLTMHDRDTSMLFKKNLKDLSQELKKRKMTSKEESKKLDLLAEQGVGEIIHSDKSIKFIRNGDGSFNVEFYVDAKIVDKIESFAFSATDTKFRISELFTYARSVSEKIFSNKDVILKNDDLTFSALKKYLTSVAVYLFVYEKKYKIGRDVERVMDKLKENRKMSEKSFFPLLCYWRTHSDGPFGGTRNSLRDRLYKFKRLNINVNTMIVPAQMYFDTVSIKASHFRNNFQYLFSVPVICKDIVKKMINKVFDKTYSLFYKEIDFDDILPKALEETVRVPIPDSYRPLVNSSKYLEKLSRKQEKNLKVNSVTLIHDHLSSWDYSYVMNKKESASFCKKAWDLVFRIKPFVNFQLPYVRMHKNLHFKFYYQVSKRFQNCNVYHLIKDHKIYFSIVFNCRLAKKENRIKEKFVRQLDTAVDFIYEEIVPDYLTLDFNDQYHTINHRFPFKARLLPQASFEEDNQDLLGIYRLLNYAFEHNEVDWIYDTYIDPETKFDLDNKDVMNRSQLKLAEIHKELLFDKPIAKFFDVCSAPGGFSKYLTEEVLASGYCVTLKSRNSIPQKFQHKHLVDFSEALEDFDLTSMNQVDSILEGFDDFVDLVVADGGFTNCDYQEIMHLKLLASEIYFMSKVLNKSGNFVIKFFAITHPLTKILISVLFSCFSSISFYKPKASKLTNFENYLVCFDYNPDEFRLDVITHIILHGFNSALSFENNKLNNAFLSMTQQVCNLSFNRQVDVLVKIIEGDYSKATAPEK